ncbi:hypothetical protein BHE74_00016249 [Ensete ventricosum]|nr:hypothetical protein BHE74_00016249 [Ensete ventricosum]
MREVEFRSIFRAPSRKLKILAIPIVIAHGKSYEHSFVKKCVVIKFAQISIGFSCTVTKIQNTGNSQHTSQGKLYEHGFTKKRDDHKLYAKLCTKSSFEWFFAHHIRN